MDKERSSNELVFLEILNKGYVVSFRFETIGRKTNFVASIEKDGMALDRIINLGLYSYLSTSELIQSTLKSMVNTFEEQLKGAKG